VTCTTLQSTDPIVQLL